MSLDVVFLAWNRLAFTEAAFEALLANTNWDRVRSLRVYDDGSTDGTREYLDAAIARTPVDSALAYLGFRSPVKTMLHYLGTSDADAFCKIDSDIACPPGWLEHLLASYANTGCELIGMAAGWTGIADADPPGVETSSHIGGVGLMQTEVFRRFPTLRGNGRMGFTDFQTRHSWISRGWVTPDIAAPQLDLIPDEPWRSLAEEYVARGWARPWPPYNAASHAWWDWVPVPA